MKRLIFCLAISSLILIKVSAQENIKTIIPDSVINKKMERMKKELNLSQEQLNSVKVLMSENARKNEQFKKELKDLRELKKQNDETFNKKMSEILTPEQFQKYELRKSMVKTKNNEARIKEKIAYYREELKLTEQQSTDLKVLMEKTELSKKELKNKFKDNKELMKDELKKLKTENKEQLKKILNEEQIRKLKELPKPGLF